MWYNCLVLIGTPTNGNDAVSFDENTEDHVNDFLVPTFSAPEIYAVLTMVRLRTHKK